MSGTAAEERWEMRMLRLLDRVRVGSMGLAVALVLLCALPRPHFPAGLAAGAQRGAGGTLRLFYWQAPTIINPHLSAGTKDLSASRITYEPLASYDEAGTLVPFLAAEIPSLENGGVAADGRSVTWRLKQGVQWSDGEPFTADDVVFTYEYVANPEVASTSAAVYAGVERVEASTTTPSPSTSRTSLRIGHCRSSGCKG